MAIGVLGRTEIVRPSATPRRQPRRLGGRSGDSGADIPLRPLSGDEANAAGTEPTSSAEPADARISLQPLSVYLRRKSATVRFVKGAMALRRRRRRRRRRGRRAAQLHVVQTATDRGCSGDLIISRLW
jgi:hypothetical protein